MGTETYYGMNVSRLFDKPVDMNKQAIANSIAYDIPISMGLKAAQRGSLANTARRAVLMAKRGRYPLGLPDGAASMYNVDDTTIQLALEAVTGTTVSVSSVLISNGDPVHYARKYVSTLGVIDPETDQVHNPTGDIEALRVSEGWSEIYFEGVVSYTDNPVSGNTYTVELRFNGGSTAVASLQVPLTFDVSNIYFQVEYEEVDPQTNESVSELKFWEYDLRDDSIPTLHESQVNSGDPEFYPQVPYRNHFSSYGDANFKKRAKQLSDLMSIDYDQLDESLAKATGDARVHGAVQLWAIDASSDNEDAMAYVHAYFGSLFDNGQGRADSFDYINQSIQNSASVGRVRATSTYQINWSEPSTGIRNYTTYKAIRSSVRDDVLEINPRTGKPVIHKTVRTYTTTEEHYWGSRWRPGGNGRNPGYDRYKGTRQVPTLVLERQINATQVRTITIVGLQYSNTVARALQHKTLGSGLNKGVLVPLSHRVCTEIFSLRNHHRIMFEGAWLAVGTIQEVHTKWYQSGIFKFVFTVIVIVVAVITAPLTGGSSFAAAATIVGTTTGILVYSVTAALIALQMAVVSTVATAIAKQVSPEFALILQLAAMAYGATKGMPSNPWAAAALQVAGSVSTAKTDQVLTEYKEKFEELHEQMGLWEDELKALQDQLDRDIYQAGDLSDYVTRNPTDITVPSVYLDRVLNYANNTYNVVQIPSQYIRAATSPLSWLGLMSIDPYEDKRGIFK